MRSSVIWALVMLSGVAAIFCYTSIVSLCLRVPAFTLLESRIGQTIGRIEGTLRSRDFELELETDPDLAVFAVEERIKDITGATVVSIQSPSDLNAQNDAAVHRITVDYYAMGESAEVEFVLSFQFVEGVEPSQSFFHRSVRVRRNTGGIDFSGTLLVLLFFNVVSVVSLLVLIRKI